MKRTVIHGLIAGLSTGLLAACGGADSSSSHSEMLATTTACYAAWNSATAYNGGATVSYNGVNYVANWWTQGNNPSTNNGGAGSGQPWTSQGACGSSPTPTPAPTPTPTPAPTPTPTPAPTPTPTPTPAPTPTPTPACSYKTWTSGVNYPVGQIVLYSSNGKYYKEVNAGTNGSDGTDPTISTWYWQPTTCSGSPTPTPTPAPTPAPTPTPTPAPTPAPTPTPTGGPLSFSFSQYKEISTGSPNFTGAMQTQINGSTQSQTAAMPAKNTTLTWAFAAGNCGSETWDGTAGSAIASGNVQAFVNAGKKYIVSTGGAGQSFLCSSDANFSTFIKRYYSANMIGVDFDIENGQSQTDINNLVQRAINAQSTYPNMRFSFTIATNGGSSATLDGQALMTVNAIKNLGMKNYLINLMVMDYGVNSSSICTLNSSGKCDMGASANKAATNLHNQYGIPYNQIELTPMIGENDSTDEIFSIANAQTMSAFVKSNGLAGVHFWDFDRDRDCAFSSSGPSDTCNGVGNAGTLGFTNTFISSLGL